MKTIDSIKPPARQPLGSKRPPQRQPGTGARFTAFTRTPKRRMAWGLVLAIVLSPLLFALALVGMAGIGVLTVFGIIVLLRRWPSRTSFILALAALLYTLILQLAAADTIAQSMAVLAYILLAIGVISLAFEVKMSSRMWFKKH